MRTGTVRSPTGTRRAHPRRRVGPRNHRASPIHRHAIRRRRRATRRRLPPAATPAPAATAVPPAAALHPAGALHLPAAALHPAAARASATAAPTAPGKTGRRARDEEEDPGKRHISDRYRCFLISCTPCTAGPVTMIEHLSEPASSVYPLTMLDAIGVEPPPPSTCARTNRRSTETPASPGARECRVIDCHTTRGMGTRRAPRDPWRCRDDHRQ